MGSRNLMILFFKDMMESVWDQLFNSATVMQLSFTAFSDSSFGLNFTLQEHQRKCAYFSLIDICIYWSQTILETLCETVKMPSQDLRNKHRRRKRRGGGGRKVATLYPLFHFLFPRICTDRKGYPGLSGISFPQIIELDWWKIFKYCGYKIALRSGCWVSL